MIIMYGVAECRRNEYRSTPTEKFPANSPMRQGECKNSPTLFKCFIVIGINNFILLDVRYLEITNYRINCISIYNVLYYR